MSGAKYIDSYRTDAGMDEAQERADAASYQSEPDYVVNGRAGYALAGGWTEVGSNYAMDPMGEERRNMSYEESSATGFIGKMGATSVSRQPTRMLSGGGNVADTPQTYTRYKE